jgi:hypothetical protein
VVHSSLSQGLESDISSLSPALDDNLGVDFLVDERARELAGEQTRWLDLKRWGLLVDRVKKHNPQAQAVADKHYLRPIPQTQIDRTAGGTFAQNPGY